MELNRKLVLESGQEFRGIGLGADKDVVGEIIFNTSMVGYQEIISDPAYAGQIVVMTYPPMGQYGITDEDFESRQGSASALVIREYCDTPSNFRFTKTLSEELEERGAACISGLDTRMLTRIIRDHGTMRAAIVSESTSTADALELIKSTPAREGLVKEVSTAKRWFKRTPHHSHDVVVVDLGVKNSLVQCLIRRGCNVTVVPFDTCAEEILGFNPDGVMISSGPGDPRELESVANVVRELKGKLPISGVGLGHCVVAMAYGAGIGKLKAGHHGGRPVRNLMTGKIEAVEHNHNFVVPAETLPSELKTVFEDVVDKTVEGLICEQDKVITCQFCPEGAPGPEEAGFFDGFVGWMK